MIVEDRERPPLLEANSRGRNHEGGEKLPPFQVCS